MNTQNAIVADIVNLSGVALSRAIHARDVSCVEVMGAFLSQIDRLNGRVNALVSLQPEDQLLAAARKADVALARGESAGWMHGFPQAPKDLAPVAGMVTTRGSRLFRGRVTTTDAVAVARLRKAGAIFVGRSNTPEFGFGSHTYNSVYGLTRNAFDPSRSAGGSSGGAAVAVALGMLPVSDGTDMMGSLRNPAAWNNVFGFRPSFGRVPTWPAADVYLAQFSTSGPIARSVQDIAMMLAVQAGPDLRVPFSSRESPATFAAPLERDLRGARIGWLGDLSGYLPMEAGLLDVCERALLHFGTIECKVEAVSVQFSFEKLWNAWETLRSAYAAYTYGAHYQNLDERALLKPEAIWEIERGLSVSAMDLHQASSIRTAWYQEVVRLFDHYDYLVLPSAQVFPFDAGISWPSSIGARVMSTYHRWMEVAIPATMAGLPALNLPAGFNEAGLPIGLQLIGPSQADFAVLALGHAYEQVSNYATRRSSLLS